SVRTLLRGLGIAVVAAGAWITGVLDLGGNGVRSIIDWAQRTPLDTMMISGLVVAGVGALLWVIGSFIKPVSKAVAKERRAVRAAAPAKPGAPSKQVEGRTTAPSKAPPAGPVDPDDAEIEALLRKRGIQ
ncbi:MAG TPA: hypothetical protein VLR88_02105, partial [Propionibacteriaceae bacterium]|nr:hypothetical protein [Propionibacteriaceae bacterium]